MNEAVQDMIDDLKSFEESKDEIILNLVKDNEREVIQRNTENQLYDKGINAEGQKITPAYSKNYVSIKQKLGQPYDRVTLKKEGDFHESFFIKYGQDEFTIDATDEKRIFLEKRYGEQIYGLTEESLDWLINTIKERFIEEARKIILK